MSNFLPTIALNHVVLDPFLQSKLAQVTVQQMIGEPSRFSLTFETDVEVGDYKTVNNPRVQPTVPFGTGLSGTVSVVVPRLGVSSCLIHGPITDRSVQLRDGGSGSSLTISGQDSSMRMDRSSFQLPQMGVTAQLNAMAILGRYGFVPAVDFTVVPYPPTERTQNQVGTDLQFLKKIADNNGKKFWMSYEAVLIPGGVVVIEIANLRTAPPRFHITAPPSPFPPEIVPKALKINVNETTGDCKNMPSFQASADSERPVLMNPLQARIDDKLGVPVPSPATTVPLAFANSALYSSIRPPMPGLPLMAALGPRSLLQTQTLPTPGGTAEYLVRADAALGEAAFFVNASAKTTLNAFDYVLRPGQMVPVRGVGKQFNGTYFVTSVTHTIDEKDHVMEAELVRNALGPPIPV